MKVTIRVEKEFEAKTLHVRAGVRYWEDATVNGEEDSTGLLIPCRIDENWCVDIDIDSGQITNWINGNVANIHYKVCDDFDCCIYDEEGNEILRYDGYVPKTLSPERNGYGDYIKMKVDENGFIKNWNFDISDFTQDED